MWLTNKETGGKFNTDWIDEEAKQKESQIAANKREADKKNSKVFDYNSLVDDPEAMCMELYKRTGINIYGRTKSVDDRTLAVICNTLEDLQQKFHINAVPDPNAVDGDRLQIHVPSYYDHEFEGAEHENDFANARLCQISLNPKYYSVAPEELDEIYDEGVKGDEDGVGALFHPAGTTSKDIIAHEVAHHLLDMYAWEHCGHRFDKYSEVQKWLTSGEYHNPADPNKTVYDLDDKFKAIYEEFKNNEEFRQFWGGGAIPNLLAVATKKYNSAKYCISDYAGKNRHELVAEAFADFYANGKNAKLLSRIIVKHIFGFE